MHFHFSIFSSTLGHWSRGTGSSEIEDNLLQVRCRFIAPLLTELPNLTTSNLAHFYQHGLY